MYQVDAIAQELVEAPGPRKRRRLARDKRRKPAQNKTPFQEAEPEPTPDDLTEIPGVGDATAAALRETGIVTFEQLRTADVSWLHPFVQRAIERWRGEDS